MYSNQRAVSLWSIPAQSDTLKCVCSSCCLSLFCFLFFLTHLFMFEIISGQITWDDESVIKIVADFHFANWHDFQFLRLFGCQILICELAGKCCCQIGVMVLCTILLWRAEVFWNGESQMKYIYLKPGPLSKCYHSNTHKVSSLELQHSS